MPAKQPQQMGEAIRPDTAFTLLFLTLGGHCACFWPFTRRRFGAAAFHFNGLAAMALMLAYGALAPCPEMSVFFAGWFIAVTLHRLADFIRRRRGWDTHSRDDGEPWLVQAIIRPRPGDFVAKTIFEPLLCLAVGALLMPWWQPLGLFVMAGALSLAVKKGIERGIEQAKLRVWRDKEFEMRALFARYRERR